MTSIHDEFANYCAELLSPAGPVRVRRMFGGHGLYVGDVFVAIVAGERLYLKADDASRARFEAVGCSPFTYSAKGRRNTALGFYTVPDEAMESPALMRPWARLALEAALRARAAKEKTAALKPRAAAGKKTRAAAKTRSAR